MRRLFQSTMIPSDNIEVRPARRADAGRAAEFLMAAPAGPGASESSCSFILTHPRDHVVALANHDIVGLCLVIPGTGRCAVLLPPRLMEWDETLAARLLRAAAGHAAARHKARLIQVLTDPEGGGPLDPALERAGLGRLAVLSYMRRAVRPEDLRLEPGPGLQWLCYSRLRHGRFARTIALTYHDSLDCPGLAGLRSVNDAIATHKHTGTFNPQTWRLVMAEKHPVGVVLVNNLQGRGELVYAGVVPEARGRGIGRTLLQRAIRDTAEMGLPQMGLAVDVANAPAMRLYGNAGFREIRRRLAWFIPKERLESLGA